MSFPVIDAPILIDVSGAGHASRQSGSEVNPMGPFLNGTDLYVAFANTTDSSVRIFKSTDRGDTWTLEDDGGSPDAGSVDPHSLNVFYDDSAKIIYVSYLITGVDRKLVAFDTNTDTYAAPISWGFASTIFFERTAVLIRQLSGVFQLFYSDNSSGNINYITLTGTTPSGPTMLVNLAGAKRDVDCGIQDASGAIHISYGADPGTRFYIRVSSGLAVTDGPTSFGANDGFRADVLITSTNQLVFAWTDFSTILVEISPSLTTPSFTKYTVATNGTGGDFNYASLAEDVDGNLLAFWAYVSSGDGIDEIDSSTFDGVSTWSAPVLFYDEITNPPADSAPFQFVHTGEVLQLADGTWLYITAMETVSPTGCTGFALRIPAAPVTPQTLTLHKTVQGGPAAPSDFTLIATGGSPETEFSGPGPVVGPVDVNPGVFELSEIAPGGATWNSETGTWDNNNNTWDGGDYTPVWDCAGAPMPTPTSVLVSPGGGGPIPLGVTQVPDADPTFQPLLSNGPFEFEIGGFLYQVLWNSGNRLGMFRRQATVGGTFTEVDPTNAPTGISGYGRATSRDTKISVCYMLPGNTTAQMIEFDAVAGTWGTPSAAVTLPAVTNLFCWVRRSDDTDVFVGAWASAWYYITNTAGVWGAVTNLFAHLGTVLGGVIDANDTIWFMVNYDFGADLTSVGLYPLSSTYVLGAAIANRNLIFQGPPFPYRFYPDVALYGTNAIAFAYSTAVAPTDNCQLKVDIIRPLSAPVLTSFLVIISPAGSQSYLLKLKDDGSGVLNLFYVHETTTPTNQVLQTHWDDPFNWTAPTVFYDPATAPPDHGSASQQISSLDPVPVSGWAVGAGMQTDQPTEITTAEIVQESSGGGPVDVVCTVTNFFQGPPPGPPGPGESNPVGCFELLRLDVTLMPARHLPVRGSTR
jgi:hypothetical protein